MDREERPIPGEGHVESHAAKESVEEAVQELIHIQKKQAVRLHVMMIVNVILAVGILLALAVMVPRTLQMVQEVGSVAGDAERMVQDAAHMVEDADRILMESADDIEDALENFNNLDMETLNEAINNLAAAVKPLAELSRLFG